MDSHLKLLLEKSLSENGINGFKIQSVSKTASTEKLQILFNIHYLENKKVCMNLFVFDSAVAHSVISSFVNTEKHNKYDTLDLINNLNVAFKGSLCFTLDNCLNINIMKEYYSENRSLLELSKQITKNILFLSSDYKEVLCDIYKKYS